MKNKYDVIIIGAGIGGLVCGCFLAKSGLKVMIVERNHQPGGYCVSFKRGRYSFDAGPHSLGSGRANGQLGKLEKELKINGKISFIQKDPSNIVLLENSKIEFFNDTRKTTKHFQDIFPREADKVKEFFDFLNVSNIGFLYSKLKDLTFKQLLDNYFRNDKLKLVLGLILGNLGLSPSKASAFTASILYREHIFDGGYYPEGGMQVFSDVLADKFLNDGGEIKILSEVKEVIVNDRKEARGVQLKKGDRLFSDFIVANCDANQLYLKLINRNFHEEQFLNNLNTMKPSCSFFVVYLGLKENIKDNLTNCSTLWYFPKLNLDEVYNNVSLNKLDFNEKYIVCGFPAANTGVADTIHLLVLAPFLNKEYWAENKNIFSENLIKRGETIFPGLSKNIEKYSTATPYDFYRYTLNTNGAISGWTSTPDQINSNYVSMASPIRNLFLAGHWALSSGGQGGIPMVIYSGKMAAKEILKIKGQL